MLRSWIPLLNTASVFKGMKRKSAGNLPYINSGLRITCLLQSKVVDDAATLWLEIHLLYPVTAVSVNSGIFVK